MYDMMYGYAGTSFPPDVAPSPDAGFTSTRTSCRQVPGEEEEEEEEDMVKKQRTLVAS